ncbi:MAG: hypothetical protein HUU49_04595 [Candidatus Buchananbacteria bacterium]|nr:hypothetical protein [Candidatus Buchananbacteria bacterium]
MSLTKKLITLGVIIALVLLLGLVLMWAANEKILSCKNDACTQDIRFVCHNNGETKMVPGACTCGKDYSYYLDHGWYNCGDKTTYPKTALREEQIKLAIERARYCNVKEDCVIINSKCPFGCSIAINKDQAETITGLIENFDSDCVYDCLAAKDFDCVNNQCVVIQPY